MNTFRHAHRFPKLRGDETDDTPLELESSSYGQGGVYFSKSTFEQRGQLGVVYSSRPWVSS